MINFFESDAMRLTSFKDKVSQFGDTVLRESKELKKTKFYSYAMKGLEILKKGFLPTTAFLFHYGEFQKFFKFYSEYTWGDRKTLSTALFSDLFKEISNTVDVNITLNPATTIDSILRTIWGIFSFPARLLGVLSGWCNRVFRGLFTGGYSGLDMSISLVMLCVLCAIALLVIYKVCKFLYKKWQSRRVK